VTDDIVSRLRNSCAHKCSVCDRENAYAVGDDAVEYIRAQQAEIERLRSVIAAFVDAEDYVSDLESVVDGRDLNERQERVAAARSALEDIVIGERIRERAANDNGRRTSLGEVAATFGIDLDSLREVDTQQAEIERLRSERDEWHQRYKCLAKEFNRD